MTSLEPLTWCVGIVVPAHNEQARIGKCLSSLLRALDAAPLRESFVVVVADRCTDSTVQLSRDALIGRGAVLEVKAGGAGAARKVGVNTLLRTFPDVPRETMWLASTDADSRVPKDWIVRQLTLAQQGVSAIAGIVRVDSFRGHGVAGAAAFARNYPIHPDGTHPHVHGANLGLRADVYLDAGGWRDIAVGEDHCLWRRVRDRGWPMRSTIESVVVTSGRLRGRAVGGFADTLRMYLRTTAAAAETETSS